MWVWALRGSRHFEPMSYSVQLHWPYRAELIIVSLGLFVLGNARITVCCGVFKEYRKTPILYGAVMFIHSG